MLIFSLRPGSRRESLNDLVKIRKSFGTTWKFQMKHQYFLCDFLRLEETVFEYKKIKSKKSMARILCRDIYYVFPLDNISKTVAAKSSQPFF